MPWSEIMPENKPLRVMATPFLAMDSDRVGYIDHRVWSMSMQMALVGVYD
jgi:hypothetical protein